MKRLLYLFFPTTAICQNTNTVCCVVDQSKTKQVVVQPQYDTVRAALLLTRKKMTIAHNYEGHAVLNAGRVVEFLDDRKKRFKHEVTIWDYRLIKNS
jgi:hypothetical protein